MRKTWLPRSVMLAVVMLTAVGVASPADATHSWGGYHWARTANPFTLKLGDNVNSTWDPHLVTTSADWTKAGVLETTIVRGASSPRRCGASRGTVQVCNTTYGNNGWLGIAQVWVSGGHITQGTVKLNDTYFNTATYNSAAWRNLVMCQEVGHTLGLDHQDEAFGNPNLDTCMDYTSNPESNQHPNNHDYDQLVAIYTHLDTTTTVLATTATPGNPSEDRASDGNPGEWGQLVRGSENPRAVATYRRDLGDDEEVFTFVIFA